MIILGTDQAAKSGWSLWRAALPLLPVARVDMLVDWGLARCGLEIAEVVQRALALADGDPKQLLYVREDHAARHAQSKYRRREGRKTQAGLGAARGWWEQELRRSGHSPAYWLSVHFEDWRRAVLGLASNVSRERAHEVAMRWASHTAGVPIDEDNVAEGICLGAYGVYDGVRIWQARRVARRLQRAS